MNVTEPLRILIVRFLSIRATKPKFYTNSLVIDLFKDSELLKQSIEKVERELGE